MSETPNRPTSDASPAEPQEETAAKEPPAKKRKIPLLDEPVFGKWCWFVTVVPMVVFLGGLGMASWIEGSRAHFCVHQQEERVLQQFYQPAKQHFERDSGESDAELKADYVGQQFRQLGLTKLNDEVSLLTELKSEEIRIMFAPLLNGAPPAEDRAWLIRLYENVQEPAKFLDQLLMYDQEGKQRPILAEYYQKFPDDYKKPDGVEAGNMWFPPDRTWYPTTYTVVVILTTISVLLVFPLYFRHPFKLTWWSVLVGVVGIVVWLALWWLDTEVLGLSKWMTKGGREAFNPLDELADTPAWKTQFMIVRFFGLVVLVPFVEEFFLRGWLMRYIEDPDWDRIPIGAATKLSIIGVAVYAVFSHNFEPLAAVVWFSMVTWLYLKTKSIWDCVAAHAITNLLLGIYVVGTGTWELW